MSGRPLYDVILDEERWAAIARLPRAAQNIVFDFFANYAIHTPTRPIPRRLKELQGDYAGQFQLRLSGGNRLIYHVDEVRRKVVVDYVGPHPDWGKSKRGAIRS